MEELQQLVIAAMQGDEEAAGQIDKIQAAAEQGDEDAVQLFEAIQEIAQELADTQENQVAQAEIAKCGTKIKKRACGGKATKKATKKVSVKKCGGKSPRKALMGAPMKKCGCGTRLHKVGGRIVETDCYGRPVPKALLGWGINNLVRAVGDGIGTLAGKAHEYGQKAIGAGQQMIGGAAQALTNGQRGAGWVQAGADKRATARTAGARTNRVIDEAAAHAGNMANAGVVAGQTIINPLWGAAAAASDVAAGKLIGNYNPVTGNRTQNFLPNSEDAEPNGTVMVTSTPVATQYVPNAVKVATTAQTAVPNAVLSTVPNVVQGTVSNQPPKMEDEVEPTEDTLESVAATQKTPVQSKYSKYGVAYKPGEDGTPVEDWENSNVTSQEVARQIRANNRQAGYEERAARRAAVPIGMRNRAYYEAQRDSMRQQREANRQARKWDRSQRAANATALMDKVQTATYDKRGGYLFRNGGTIDYGKWFN